MSKFTSKTMAGELVTLNQYGKVDSYVCKIHKLGNKVYLVQPTEFGRDGQYDWVSAEFKPSDFRRVGTLHLGYASIPQYTAR